LTVRAQRRRDERLADEVFDLAVQAADAAVAWTEAMHAERENGRKLDAVRLLRLDAMLMSKAMTYKSYRDVYDGLQDDDDYDLP
jgi:hypothetical protein